MPKIIHYDRQAYKGGTQNWSIMQGEKGIMYFGNNLGLLSFNGKKWDLLPVPNNSVVRAVGKGKNGRVYTGAYNEAGYWDFSDGKARYTDLASQLPPEERDFGEVWRIHITAYGIVFQSFSHLLLLHNDSMQVLEELENAQFSFNINNELYISEEKKGLLRYDGEKLVPVPGGGFFTKNYKVWEMLPLGHNRFMIGTQDNGMFIYNNGEVSPWETEANAFLKKNQLFGIEKLNSTQFAFGSIQDGLILCDSTGTILQHINKNNGLKNNTILSLKMDKWGNLWCGLDNGIAYIEVHSPISYINEGSKIEGSGYTACAHNQKLYLGTNQGAYVGTWTKNSKAKNFQLIKSLKGQVWKLKPLHGEVFCGHNKGTFLIKGDKARQISDIEGGWNYIAVPGNDSLVLGGVYTGLIRLAKQNGEWVSKGKVKGIQLSCRDIFFDKNNYLWMMHGYKGVFRMELTPDMDSVISIAHLFDKKQGGRIRDFNLFQEDNTIYLCVDDTIKRFNYLTQQFEYAPEWSGRFGKCHIKKIKQDPFGNHWYFCTGKNAIKLRLAPHSPWTKKLFNPLNKLDQQFINSFEFNYVVDTSNLLFGIEDGFVHFSPQQGDTLTTDFKTLITDIYAFGEKDTLAKKVCVTHQGIGPATVLNYSQNTVVFGCAAVFYENPEKNKYSYKLEGQRNENWGNWENSAVKAFMNLEHGEYTFRVRAKNVYGEISPTVSYRFQIATPWYQTPWAYLVYVLVSIGAIIFTLRVINQRIERERQMLKKQQHEEIRAKEEERRQEAIVFENKIVQLKNEKLKAEVARKISDVELKNKELASFAVQINHKNEILTQLKKEINKVKGRVDKQAKIQLNQLSRKIDEDLSLEDDWNKFKIHFDQAQDGFLQHMQENHPDLTPRDLKLCAFLRMNLSTKEIAPLMNITVRGVEIHRYRLRKKLDLNRDINLVEYLMQQ